MGSGSEVYCATKPRNRDERRPGTETRYRKICFFEKQVSILEAEKEKHLCCCCSRASSSLRCKLRFNGDLRKIGHIRHSLSTTIRLLDTILISTFSSFSSSSHRDNGTLGIGFGHWTVASAWHLRHRFSSFSSLRNCIFYSCTGLCSYSSRPHHQKRWLPGGREAESEAIKRWFCIHGHGFCAAFPGKRKTRRRHSR